MALDLEEQEQLAELKSWWRAHGNLVIGVIVAAMLGFAGWRYWNVYQANQAAQAAGLYERLARRRRRAMSKRCATPTARWWRAFRARCTRRWARSSRRASTTTATIRRARRRNCSGSSIAHRLRTCATWRACALPPCCSTRRPTTKPSSSSRRRTRPPTTHNTARSEATSSLPKGRSPRQRLPTRRCSTKRRRRTRSSPRASACGSTRWAVEHEAEASRRAGRAGARRLLQFGRAATRAARRHSRRQRDPGALVGGRG